jgi:hypothetical protein
MQIQYNNEDKIYTVIGIIHHICYQKYRLPDNLELFTKPVFICFNVNNILVTSDKKVKIIDSSIPDNWELTDNKYADNGSCPIYTKGNFCYGVKGLFSTTAINYILDDGLSDYSKLMEIIVEKSIFAELRDGSLHGEARKQFLLSLKTRVYKHISDYNSGKIRKYNAIYFIGEEFNYYNLLLVQNQINVELAKLN